MSDINNVITNIKPNTKVWRNFEILFFIILIIIINKF